MRQFEFTIEDVIKLLYFIIRKDKEMFIEVVEVQSVSN